MRRPKPRTIVGGNTYRLISPPNIVDGQPAFRGVATVIDWEYLGIDPVAQIKSNLARVPARFQPDKDNLKYDPVAVVAYGNSLRKTWHELLRWPGPIITCSGAHRFLLERGIRPTFHIDSDPRAHKPKMLGTPDRRVTYLVANIIHPSYLDVLEAAGCDKIVLWHLLFYDPPIFAVLPKDEMLMTGGDTIGPRAMKMARLMGYVNHHYFGFDACASVDGDTHASEHLNPKADRLEWHDFNGRKWLVREDWLVHASTMIADLDRMPEVKYEFHGDSLFKEMAMTHIPIHRSGLPMGLVLS